MDQPITQLWPDAGVAGREGGHGRRLVVALLGTLAIAGLVTVIGARPARPIGAAASVPTSAAIEEAWGIRITHVAVTADGGLIDVRFTVLDADRASAMIADEKNLPVLVDEGDGTIVRSAALMSAKHDVAPGRTSFMLYRNTGGTIHRGDSVSIDFGGSLRLEHVPAY